MSFPPVSVRQRVSYSRYLVGQVAVGLCTCVFNLWTGPIILLGAHAVAWRYV
jgi:hypothetical protein